MDEQYLEQTYREGLDERLINYLAEMENISLEKAMSIYYNSRIASLISKGAYGIQYLDYKVLVQMLLENEPELFQHKDGITNQVTVH